MLSPLPRHRDWRHHLAHSPSPVSLPRMGGRVGLCIGIFEACSAFTRVTACTLAGSSKMTRYIRGFSHFVTSMTAPIASGWSKIAGWDSHPLRNAAFARRTPNPVIRKRLRNGDFVLFPDPPSQSQAHPEYVVLPINTAPIADLPQSYSAPRIK